MKRKEDDAEGRRKKKKGNSIEAPGDIPLLHHALGASTVFSPEALVEAVRTERHLKSAPIPAVCILEFDGDLTDWLASTGRSKEFEPWACFHTRMHSMQVDDGLTVGIVPRTIGGPYAVLVAEQMAVSGARVILGLTSAGRVDPRTPVPGLVVVTSAVRDEGTSYHYVRPGAVIDAPEGVARIIERELRSQALPVVTGKVWTTDAPYRETKQQLNGHTRDGVLAVEMQAASLFGFSAARNFPVGEVAFVTNGAGEIGSEEFDKGTREMQLEVLRGLCRAGGRIAASLSA